MDNDKNSEIIKQEIVYDGILVIEEAKIDLNGNKFTRQRINRSNASSVLVLNTDTRKIILTKQFRYALAAKTTEPILEIVAGKIDGDELPEVTAKRETEEEIGYRINDANLKLLLSCFASPGYSTEQFFIYYATVTDADKVSKVED